MNDQQFEQLLKRATSRTAITGDDPAASLQQGYAALSQLLERNTTQIDEAALVDKVLSSSKVTSPTQPEAQRDGWLAMASLAAALLALGLAGFGRRDLDTK